MLLKPAALDAGESAVISPHPASGAAALSKFPGVPEAMRQTVLRQYEHWDGFGYPDGLTGTCGGAAR